MSSDVLEQQKLGKIIELKEGAKKPASVVLYDNLGKVIKTLTEEDLNSISKELLEMLLVDVRKFKDFGMGNTILKQLIELKKAWFPATLTSKNVNINLFDDQLNKWYKARQELREIEKNNPILIEGNLEEDENNGV